MGSHAGRGAVAADYAWGDVESEGEGLFSAYCLTLVRGVTPREFLARLGAQITFDALPLDQDFFDRSFECWDEPHHGDVQFIGATTVPGADGDWTLGLEVNGHLGVTPEVAISASAGTRLVSHRYNGGNGVGSFLWVEDGDPRLSFEPLFAYQRDGSSPDALLEDMERIGFVLDEDREDIGPTTTAAFALAERLTGVRVTEAMISDATFLCGTVHLPDPPTEDEPVPHKSFRSDMNFFSAISATAEDGDDDFEYVPEPWEGPPPHTLGAVVPLDLLAARTPNVVVALTHATVFETGIQFHLRVAARRGDMSDDRWFAIESALFGHSQSHLRKGAKLPDHIRRYGVRFADGTRAVAIADDFAAWDPGDHPPEGPVLSASGGSGSSNGDGELESEEELWLWPLPETESLEFAVEWPLAGIDLTFVELDTRALRNAAAHTRPYWDTSLPAS
ncbi:DUF6461 domain-containing protein [Spirillospora sp. CA-294931]|uniref:DUF6461 domain-containing protein n=1 Tax=Spirillospora sp. CA-294931 TaxID=3240042 RepID=UPI003D8E73B1